MKSTKLIGGILLLVIAALVASSCGGGIASAAGNSSLSTSQISKPKPVVVSVDATTAGVFDNYYAVLDITVRNDGADGVIVVVGSITQGVATKHSEMPVSLPKGSSQSIKLVFPLTWLGGEWTPTVTTKIP